MTSVEELLQAVGAKECEQEKTTQAAQAAAAQAAHAAQAAAAQAQGRRTREAAQAPQIHREEVIVDVGDAVPELDLAVAVKERARRLHGKRLDAAPQVAHVADHLSGHALHVNDKHPL
jgi:hypothetical protein